MKSKKKPYILGDPNLGIYNAAVSQFKTEEIRKINFNMSFLFAKTLRTMLGPIGSNKILINSANEVSITQKGSKVVKLFKNRLPINQLLINLAETQENICGDGTKTVILLTAFLLEKAKDLLNRGISPQLINEGFSISTRESLEILEKNAIILKEYDKIIIKQLLESIMVNRLSDKSKQTFIDYLLNVIDSNDLFFNFPNDFDFSNILFRKIHGKSTDESEIIKGMIIYKEKPNSKVPIGIINPRILLIRRTLDFFIRDNTKELKEVNIEDPNQYGKLLDFKMEYYKNLALFFKKREIKVIFCQKHINKYLIDYCASLGIIALELIGKEELEKLSKMLNINVIADINNFSQEEIGIAESIEFKKVGNEEMLFIKKENSKLWTLLLRGGSDYVLEELEESIKSALKVAIQTIKDKKFLPGGGALESEIAYNLKKYSENFSNKIQLVILEFGKALENIPAYLIRNSAKDPLDLITELRKLHKNGQIHLGFDCNSKKIINVIEQGIFDGYQVKKHLIKIACEAARQIIRVDGLIMVFNKELQQDLENQKREGKNEKRAEELKKFFKENEEEMFKT